MIEMIEVLKVTHLKKLEVEKTKRSLCPCSETFQTFLILLFAHVLSDILDICYDEGKYGMEGKGKQVSK